MIDVKKDAARRVYTHSAIQAFAETGGGVFVFVFLLDAGVSLPLVLASIAAINVVRLILRAGVLPLARRLGVRNLLIVGTLLESITYLLIPHVEGPDRVLLAFVLVGSVGSVIYWTCYHAYVAATGDPEVRGGQVGIIEALNTLAAVAAPAAVTMLIIAAAPALAFGVVALIQMAAALPLIGGARVAVPAAARADPAIRRFAFFIYLADGWAVAFTHFLWQIALFVTLGADFAAYGGTMVLAGLAGAVMSVATGKLLDRGHGRRTVVATYALAAFALAAKALSYDHAAAAVAATAVGAIAASVQIPTLMARIYNLAQESGCPLRFHMVGEAGWDIGSAAGGLSAAVLIWWGAPVGVPMWLGLIGVLVSGRLLWAQYAPGRPMSAP